MQLSAQIKLWFCTTLNRTQFVDVAPTLGVNHVISGVMVPVLFLFIVLYALILYTSDN